MRAFIGIDFDRDFKNEIFEFQQRFRKYANKGRWKYTDNFHLTLKFLDEISLTQKAEIDDAMKRLCVVRKPFNLNVTKFGVFDGKDSIRVLWFGLDGDIKELQTLQKEIDIALDPIGFPPEKRDFKPHITIGQDIVFKCGFDQIRETIGEVKFGMLKVTGLFLFKSEQVQNKRIYSKMTEYRFS